MYIAPLLYTTPFIGSYYGWIQHALFTAHINIEFISFRRTPYGYILWEGWGLFVPNYLFPESLHLRKINLFRQSCESHWYPKGRAPTHLQLATIFALNRCIYHFLVLNITWWWINKSYLSCDGMSSLFAYTMTTKISYLFVCKYTFLTAFCWTLCINRHNVVDKMCK